MRVLVADDSPTSRRVLQLHIEKMGHEVIPATDGDEALKVFLEQRPDLVLLDVVMPGRSGFDIARDMRNERPDDWIPIIFLSGNVKDQDIADGIDAGGDDYLTKPANPVVLRAKMLAMQRISNMRHQLAEANRQLVHQSNHDALTQLANRRALDDYLAKQWASAVRHGSRPLSLVMLDVDYFKDYNDHYGHQAGDECLAAISQVLRKNLLRVEDMAARFGGEEFMIVLPETPLEGAVKVGERLRREVRDLGISHRYSRLDYKFITVSVGVASTIPRASLKLKQLIKMADHALYDAKGAGRDCVCSAMLHTPDDIEG